MCADDFSLGYIAYIYLNTLSITVSAVSVVWNIDLGIIAGWVQLHMKTVEGGKRVGAETWVSQTLKGQVETETCKHDRRMDTEVGGRSVENNFKKEEVDCI